MKKILILITFSLILSPIKAESILYERDSYCYAQKGETALYMDVYKRVDTIQSSPCMLFLFGGGFTVGNRRDQRYIEYFEYLLSEGIVVVAIDYRLGMVGIENEPYGINIIPSAVTNALPSLIFCFLNPDVPAVALFAV